MPRLIHTTLASPKDPTCLHTDTEPRPVNRNRSFQDSLPETKWAYIENRSAGILRAVAGFAQDVLKSNQVKRAIKDYIMDSKDGMKDK